MCQVGGWCLLHLVHLEGCADGVGLSPIRWPKGCWNLPEVLCPGSCLGEIDLVHLLLAVMLMRMTHQCLPPLRVGIPSAHGSRWPPMRWMGSHGISHTPGIAYNVPSKGG